jgi:hypothetical protein
MKVSTNTPNVAWLRVNRLVTLPTALKIAEALRVDDAPGGTSDATSVPRELFDHLSANEQSLVDFMRTSPLQGYDDIEFERNRSLPREVTL